MCAKLKSLLKITLLVFGSLVCNLGFSQQMHLKSYTYQYTVGTDILNIYTYYYNDDYSLDSVVLHDQNETTYGTYLFENDRIIEEHYGSRLQFWKYFDNLVQQFAVQYNDTTLENTYFLNEDDQLCIDTLGHLINYCSWENGNLLDVMTVNTIAHDTTRDPMIYDENILNPWYESNKFFRHDFWGSVNFIKKIKAATFTVEDAINNYPKFVTQEVGGKMVGTYTFDYYMDPEDEGDSTLLSISYHNLLGQKIEKPKHGFYIERELTTKGVVGKKYFMQ